MFTLKKCSLLFIGSFIFTSITQADVVSKVERAIRRCESRVPSVREVAQYYAKSMLESEIKGDQGGVFEVIKVRTTDKEFKPEHNLYRLKSELAVRSKASGEKGWLCDTVTLKIDHPRAELNYFYDEFKNLIGVKGQCVRHIDSESVGVLSARSLKNCRSGADFGLPNTLANDFFIKQAELNDPIEIGTIQP